MQGRVMKNNMAVLKIHRYLHHASCFCKAASGKSFPCSVQSTASVLAASRSVSIISFSDNVHQVFIL
jgi:hypothetical protein